MTTRGWTYDLIADLTFPQIRNEVIKGADPHAARDRARAARKVLDDFKAGRL